MSEFFKLEGAYIFFAFVILVITVFVATRPFMGKGALKKGLIWVSLFLICAIALHFYITKRRMANVATAFKSGKEVLCENRIYTKGANFVTIKDNGEWSLKNDYFVSPNFTRDFFLARCIVK